jgi:hypothetical protein
LLLKPLHHCSLNLRPFRTSLKGTNTWKPNGNRSRMYVGWSNTSQCFGHMSWTVQATCWEVFWATWWHPSWACNEDLFF